MQPDDLIQEKKKPPLKDDFDPTAELWDRLTDDIIEGGAPCIDTITDLVGEASYLDPKGGKKKEE